MYAKRNEMVDLHEYTTTSRLRKLGTYFFLKLVKEVVDELNSRMTNGMSLARISLMIFGLIPYGDGL